MKISNHYLFAILRIALILASLVSILLAARLLQNLVLEHRTNKLLIEVLQGSSTEYQELLNRSEDLANSSILEGEYADFRARVQSMAFFRSHSPNIISEVVVRESIKTALQYKPYNGYLWSNYALHASALDGITSEVLSALDSAIKYGKNDYYSTQSLAFIAIREWPNLDCQYRRILLRVVDAALAKDDIILSRWSYEHGHMPIGKYIRKLMQYYEFNEKIARDQVRSCA